MKVSVNEYLQHFGILGQKWRVRRFQNEDGTLTPEGRLRYLAEKEDRDTGRSYLTEEGKKAFFKKNSSELTYEGRKAKERHKGDEVEKAISSEQFDRKYSEHWLEAYNAAADHFNRNIDDLNKKYDPDLGNDDAYEKNIVYLKACGKLWTEGYKNALVSIVGEEHPTYGKQWIERAFSYGQYDDYTSEYEQNHKRK